MVEKDLEKARKDIIHYCNSFDKNCDGCEFRMVVKEDDGTIFASKCDVGWPYTW